MVRLMTESMTQKRRNAIEKRLTHVEAAAQLTIETKFLTLSPGSLPYT